MAVRSFRPADAPRICEIFYRSVHEVASAEYERAQVDVWAPRIPEPRSWLRRLRDYDTFVAENGAGDAVAFIAMSATGYVDMLFCLPEASRCGVAGELYAAVERAAVARGLTLLTAHASLLARPFFERRGWRVETQETVVRDGVGIPRSAMSKRL